MSPRYYRALKRFFDTFAAFLGLAVAAPLIGALALLIWLQDFRFPFYCAPRIGLYGKSFTLFKLRSMVVHQNTKGVDSTAADDPRITPLGRLIRKCKFDELPQLLNVILGEMSLVGPRPNVARDVALYTAVEKHLLSVPPGLTDIASIVFADEADILAGHGDPDLSYNQLIRPWKSRLGLLYIARASFVMDLTLIGLTVTALLSRRRALERVQKLLEELGADPEVLRAAGRKFELVPYPPPGLSAHTMLRAGARPQKHSIPNTES